MVIFMQDMEPTGDVQAGKPIEGSEPKNAQLEIKQPRGLRSLIARGANLFSRRQQPAPPNSGSDESSHRQPSAQEAPPGVLVREDQLPQETDDNQPTTEGTKEEQESAADKL